MSQMVVTMAKDKTTKGSVRFSEPKKDGDPHRKNIYLTKSEVDTLNNPEAIKVTIEAA